MVSYYTMLSILCWMALGVLWILVWENSWIPSRDKRLFYLTYGIIALSSVTEWIGVQLNGNEAVPVWVLAMVKCADYILTPMAGGAFVAQMKLHDRWSRVLKAVLACNAVFQVIAALNHWMIVIDEQHRYSHGPLYTVYMLVYLLVIFIAGVEFRSYGKAYRRQNRISLYSVLLLVVIGIGMQEILGQGIRTAYLAVTIGSALMFIHYSEFYQMSANDHILQQRDQLMRDPLTGVYSRHAYMMALEKYGEGAGIPGNLTAFSIDINGLKPTNDRFGHKAGDELIIGAARCIEQAIGDSICYRTGGDEFVVVARMNKDGADAALQRLNAATAEWNGTLVGSLSLSAGYATADEYPGFTLERLVIEADQAMYAAKADYYRQNSHDRRRRR